MMLLPICMCDPSYRRDMCKKCLRKVHSFKFCFFNDFGCDGALSCKSKNDSRKQGNASLFTKLLFTIFVPLDPPLPTSKMMDFLLNFYYKGQTELRTLSQKLRTNPPKIANKQNYEQTGVSEKTRKLYLSTQRTTSRNV